MERVHAEALRDHKLTAFCFASVVLLFIAVRFWRLTASCLWFDEIFSVHAARHGWTDMARFVAADIIHPPLFYALLKVWIGIGGESLLWLRLFPALTSIAAILPFILLCRELRLQTGEMNLALLLMAVNGYLIKYAQEVRMYSLLLFFSLCSLWLFVRFFQSDSTSNKKLLALCAVNLLLVYTHYSGWLVVALEVVVLLLWRRAKLNAFLLTVAALVLSYLPWIYAIATGRESGKGLSQNIGWVTRPHAGDLAQYFTLLNKPFLSIQSSADARYDPLSLGLAFFLFGIPLLILGWRLITSGLNEDRSRAQAVCLLFLFSLGSVLLVFLFSWLLPYSIWGTRHLIIAAGPYSILSAVALSELRPYWTRVTLFLVLGCWFVLAGLILLVRRPPVFTWCAWEELAPQMMNIESSSNRVVQVYAFEDLVAYQLWFTLNAAENPRLKVNLIKNMPGLTEDPAYFLPRRFTDIAVRAESLPNEDHFWLAFRAKQLDETQPPLNALQTMGYRVDKVISKKVQGQEAFLVEVVHK
jgi:uncharacterized membrane protein